MIVRVPLASGLLTGKYTRETTFGADDHRTFNRHGEAFDVGETFAGVPFEVGLDAVEELRPLVPEGATLAQLALRWILMHDAVSTIIPGARSAEQAAANAAAADLPPLSDGAMARIAEVYEQRIAPHVHQRWWSRDTLSGAHMDDSPLPPELVIGDSFARILTETTQSLVCVYDADGRILLFNEACERATGFTREEVLGRPAREFVIPPEEADAFSEFLTYVWRTGTPSPQVGHWMTKDGGRRLVAWSNRLLDGTGLVTTGIDLTDREANRDQALEGDPEAKLIEVSRVANEQKALRRVATLVASEATPERIFTGVSDEVRARPAGQRVGRAALRGRRHGGDRRPPQPRQPGRLPARRVAARGRRLRAGAGRPHLRRPPGSTTGAGRAPRSASAPATAPPPPRRSWSAACSGARSGSRARTRCRPTPRTASARSASSCRSASRPPRPART